MKAHEAEVFLFPQQLESRRGEVRCDDDLAEDFRDGPGKGLVERTIADDDPAEGRLTIRSTAAVISRMLLKESSLPWSWSRWSAKRP